MKAAVIGTGQVAATLGGQLLNAGYTVKYGSRDPQSDKVKELLSKQSGASADTVSNCTDWAEVIVLATASKNTEEAIAAVAKSLGSGVAGKVVIDATNPVSEWPKLEWMWESGKSAGEILQEQQPEAIVYKAFNTVGENVMAHGDGATIKGWSGGQLSMLYAGGPDKKDVAEQIISDIGWKPVYVGPIRYARNLEALAELWIHLGIPPNGIGGTYVGRDFHFEPIGMQLP